MSKGYCNIKGRGIKICQGSYEDFMRHLEKLPESKRSIWTAYLLIHYGLEANCVVKGVEIDFTLDDTIDFVDSLSQEDIDLVTKTYNEVFSFEDGLPKEETKKKKQVKSTSTHA